MAQVVTATDGLNPDQDRRDFLVHSPKMAHVFLSQYLIFPFQYHSTNAPHSFLYLSVAPDKLSNLERR